MSSSKKISYGPVRVFKTANSSFNKEGQKSIVIAQDLTIHYGQGKSNVASLFGAEIGTNIATTRYIPIVVPEIYSEEQVQMKLNSYPEATIYNTLSHEPIITPELKAAIQMGMTTVEAIAEKQLVRDANGEIVKDRRNGALQYSLKGFSLDRHEDIDLRTYAEVEIKQTEGEGVIDDQGLNG